MMERRYLPALSLLLPLLFAVLPRELCPSSHAILDLTHGKQKGIDLSASVAGPALAFWLHRYGFEVTVVERAPGIRPGGYAIDFRGPAMQVWSA